jgi:hypothetical protein
MTRRTRTSVRCLLGAALVVLSAGEARAQVGCLPTNPRLICSVTECVALQATVSAECKTGESRACSPTDDCGTLEAKKANRLACYTARIIINARCFGGGDEGHQQQAAQEITGVAWCQGLIEAKCQDPCP